MQYDPDREITMYQSLESPVAFDEKVDTNNLIQINEWCSNYGRFRQFNGDSNARERLTIALYQLAQIKQNIEHHSEHAQAAAAFCIHLLASVAQAGFRYYPNITKISNIEFITTNNDNTWIRPYSSLLVLNNLSQVSQQINYKVTCPPGTARYARINEEFVSITVNSLIRHILSFVDPDFRAIAFRREMNLLLNREWLTK